VQRHAAIDRATASGGVLASSAAEGDHDAVASLGIDGALAQHHGIGRHTREGLALAGVCGLSASVPFRVATDQRSARRLDTVRAGRAVGGFGV
jgi:hypothetical protein